jgi:hypothetical protein
VGPIAERSGSLYGFFFLFFFFSDFSFDTHWNVVKLSVINSCDIHCNKHDPCPF